MKFIYGTGNKGKVEQVKDFFRTQKNIELEILSLKDIGFDEEIIEDGKTFEENSEIKAKAIKSFCEKNNINEMIIADDAGLCVDALNGRPGVLSARYAGDHAPQEIVIEKLLGEMQGVPEEKRTASFVCVLTAILQNGEKIQVRGETKGKIAVKSGKMEKLTYDPVFIPDEIGRVMSEVGGEELKITYRQKAFLNLINILEQKKHE
jgi:XTP/dITP diphosphohydrolase